MQCVAHPIRCFRSPCKSTCLNLAAPFASASPFAGIAASTCTSNRHVTVRKRFARDSELPVAAASDARSIRVHVAPGESTFRGARATHVTRADARKQARVGQSLFCSSTTIDIRAVEAASAHCQGQTSSDQTADTKQPNRATHACCAAFKLNKKQKPPNKVEQGPHTLQDTRS